MDQRQQVAGCLRRQNIDSGRRPYWRVLSPARRLRDVTHHAGHLARLGVDLQMASQRFLLRKISLDERLIDDGDRRRSRPVALLEHAFEKSCTTNEAFR